MSINIETAVELSNKIISGGNVNLNIFVNGIYILFVNKNYIDNKVAVHIPLIKNAIDKISEKYIIPEFMKLINIYQYDIENYNKILIRQYKLDNRILMNNRYFLSENIYKYFNMELLKYILNIHDVSFIIYFIKSLKQKNYSLSLNDKKILLDILIKYFNDLDNDYSLIYLYSFINDNYYNNDIDGYDYTNMLYNKINDTLSNAENIEIFKKTITTRNYELIKSVILKIKNYFSFNFSVINSFYNDQKKNRYYY